MLLWTSTSLPRYDTQQKKPQTLEPPAAPAKPPAAMRTRSPQKREDCKDLTFSLQRLEWSAEGNATIYRQEETCSTLFPSFLLSHTCNLRMGTRTHTHKPLLECNSSVFFLSISARKSHSVDKCRPDEERIEPWNENEKGLFFSKNGLFGLDMVVVNKNFSSDGGQACVALFAEEWGKSDIKKIHSQKVRNSETPSRNTMEFWWKVQTPVHP